MKHLNLSTFEENVFDINESEFKGDVPCIIDFYADWCAPCKVMEPTLNELEKEYSGKVNFFKINVDDNYELSSAFNIRSIPTVMYCSSSKGNEKPHMVSGVRSKTDIKQTITQTFNI